MNKLDFGRNLNIEKFENDEWTEMVDETDMFKVFDKKELFLLCLALGYKSNLEKPIDTTYPTVNATLSEMQKYTLLSYGFDNIGDDALSKIKEIKSSASKYAKGGFSILKRLKADSDSELVFASQVYNKIKELSNR